jgi:lysophospholipase L1-like esterase
VLTLALAGPGLGQASKETPGGAIKVVRIVLVGDSTVTDESGWGRGFARRLTSGATCVNRARSGRSSRSFRAEGHWSKALAERPDYVLIQFGHNDQPGKGPDRETDPKSSYREYLASYIDDARAAGATPILVTPMTRRTLRDGRVADDGLARYSEAARAVAAEKKVPLVDLYARSVAAVEAMGQEAADALGPTTKESKPDRTHLNAEGSRSMSRLVADGLRVAEPSLAPYLKPSDVDENAPGSGK